MHFPPAAASYACTTATPDGAAMACRRHTLQALPHPKDTRGHGRARSLTDLRAKHGTGDALDCTMILFNNVGEMCACETDRHHLSPS